MELNNLLQFIKNKESYGGNYNIMARDKQETDRALTSKTIKEVLSEQAKNNNRAAGAYQIIPSTMKMLMKRMKLTGDEKFDEAMQDKMAIELLRHRGLDKFNTGDLSAEEFGNNLAKEWASLPLLTDIGDKKAGSSYYQGQHGNVALAGADEFSNIVKNISTPPPVADAGVNITQPIGLPDLTNKEDIKRVQQAIGVKADGIWGPKSKEAWTNVNNMFVTDTYRQEGMQAPVNISTEPTGLENPFLAVRNWWNSL